MKKVLCLLLLCALLLVGCGEARKSKLTATITEKDSNGTIDTTLEIIFSNDVVSSAKEEKKFSNRDAAQEYFELLQLLNENNKGVIVEKSGSKVTETVSSIGSGYKYSGMSKQAVTEVLESQGWDVK